MKKLITVTSLLVFCISLQVVGQALQPYYSIGSFNRSIKEEATIINNMLNTSGFQVIGSYHPEGNSKLYVMCFTNNELGNLSLQFKDRGALGSVLKVAIVEKNGESTVSFLNPEYMFLAYWGKRLNGQGKQLIAFSEKVKNIFSTLGTLKPFGGEVDKDDLPEYHYKIFMPYFTDPDELNTFDSFEQGLKTIRKNLYLKKGNTIKVYEQVFQDKQVAVFGVGLLDKEDGEAFFLPIIGEENIAAMPYELILQGKEATALQGKYRFAIFWPELSMGTFMKIVSTPGDVEDMLKELTK